MYIYICKYKTISKYKNYLCTRRDSLKKRFSLDKISNDEPKKTVLDILSVI